VVYRSLPFHPVRWSPILPIKGWTSTLRCLRVCKGKGRPRYFPGNLQIFPRKFWISWFTASKSTLIGKISLFEMLTLRPEHSQQSVKAVKLWNSRCSKDCCCVIRIEGASEICCFGEHRLQNSFLSSPLE